MNNRTSVLMINRHDNRSDCVRKESGGSSNKST